MIQTDSWALFSLLSDSTDCLSNRSPWSCPSFDLQLDSRPEPDTEYKKAAPLQRTKPLLYRNLNGKQPSLWSSGPDDPGQHNQQYPRQKQERRQYAAHYPQNSKNGHHYHGVQNQGSVGGGVVPTGRAAGSRLCSTTG